MDENNNFDNIRDSEPLALGNPTLNPASNATSHVDEIENKKSKGCKFPTAYTILIIIELIVFLLTYIIPKGTFDKIEYSSKKDIFIITSQNGTEITINATQSVLDELNVKIPLESFQKGYIKKPISIPDTYKRMEGETTNFFKYFFNLFLFPIKGLIESADISFFLFVLGGNLSILMEMNALSAGISALSRVTKGKEFLLCFLVFIIISLSGSLFGMMEEFLPFYPILVPIFLKSGFDGMLSFVTLYLSTIIGNMFSLINPFSVVIGSYSAGINFIDGFSFRLISFFIGHIIVFIYIFIYYRKIKKNPKSSVVYEIKKNIDAKFLVKEENIKNEEEKVETEEVKTEIEEGKEEIEENKKDIEKGMEENLISKNKEKKEKPKIDKKDKFTCLQKIAIIVFIGAFGIMVYGIMALDWWFEHMTAVFAGFSLLLMFILNKGEQKAIETFIKGAGDFIGVSIIIGVARGINITLDEGKILDTILNSMTGLITDLPPLIFAVIMLIRNMIWTISVILVFMFVNIWEKVPVISALLNVLNSSENGINHQGVLVNLAGLVILSGLLLYKGQKVFDSLSIKQKK
jgi:uncharacterized ion transporter superfamily protein YfcC